MRRIFIVALATLISVANAEPGPLQFDRNVKNHSKEKYVRAVHQEIVTDTSNIDDIRYRILQGMLFTPGRVWTYEGEGDGYILARFDYREIITVMRIEYDERLVQLKYHDAGPASRCETLADNGICYKNGRAYYNYTKNLRTSISLQFTPGSEG